MNIQRLKFAQARGAHIQLLKQGKGGYEPEWTTLFCRFDGPETDYRIHPDYEHLQYGPLSTELRRRAIENDFEGVEVVWHKDELRLPLWEGIWADFDVSSRGFQTVRSVDGLMHLLFVAELLADEGL